MLTLDDLTPEERAALTHNPKRVTISAPTSGPTVSEDEYQIRRRTSGYDPLDNKYSRHRYIKPQRIPSGTGTVISWLLFWPIKLFIKAPSWGKFVLTIWAIIAGCGLVWVPIIYHQGMKTTNAVDATAMTVAATLGSLIIPAILVGVCVIFGLFVRAIINAFLNKN